MATPVLTLIVSNPKLVMGTLIDPEGEVNPKDTVGSCNSTAESTLVMIPNWFCMGRPCLSCTWNSAIRVVRGGKTKVS